MTNWTLHIGDCLDPVTGMAILEDESVDHVITDPPYGDHIHRCQRQGHVGHEVGTGRATFNRSTALGFDPIDSGTRSAASIHLSRLLRRWALIFSDTEGAHLWREELEAGGLEYVRTCFWRRLDGCPQFTGDRPAMACEAITAVHLPGRKRWNGGGRAGFYAVPVVQNRGGNCPRNHTTEKPLALMQALVRDFTDPGDLILDPFAGSGTTGVAALSMGRRFVGWEKEPKYHAIARKRLERTREQLEMVG